jgi:hypothetical protein
MQPTTSPGAYTVGFWTMMDRLRAYRHKKGPESCRKNGFGLVRAELEMAIEGFSSSEEQSRQSDVLLRVVNECRKCQLCRLGHE